MGAQPLITEGERTLRRLLWLRHGCPHSHLYGDDGEMQCADCFIDFLRDPPAEIEACFRTIGLREVTEAIAENRCCDIAQATKGQTHRDGCPGQHGAKTVCAPCSQGRHSPKGFPEYGIGDRCPDSRCGCTCRAETCRWEFYGRRCTDPADPSGFCAEHSGQTCAGCGSFATHACPEELQLVCGAPICDACAHTEKGHGPRQVIAKGDGP